MFIKYIDAYQIKGMSTVKDKQSESVDKAGRDRETQKRIPTQLILLKSARARLDLIFFRKVILLRKLILTNSIEKHAADEHVHVLSLGVNAL